MRSITALLATLFILLSTTQKTFSQEFQLSDKAFVSLLTCGPGNELYSVFGHTALRINDPVTGIDAVFNYGTFDFDTPNFYLKFVKGDLQYFVSASSYQDFVYTYQYYNRDVYEQRLNLSHDQVEHIANKLRITLTSNDRFYTYKYFERNCTTMVADILDTYIPEKIAFKTKDKGKTYRKVVTEYLDNAFYENLGISLIFGSPTDRPIERLFLPEQLLEGVSSTQIATGSLAQPVVTVYKSTATRKASAWNNYYTYIIACLVLLFLSRNKIVHRTLLALLGLLGLFFYVVGAYSFHAEISYNYNALLINPLFLAMLYFIFTGRATAAKYTVYTCFGCIAIYIAILLNKPYLVLVLPLIALISGLLIKVINPQIFKVKTA
ncbi:DUF4105 domain-containing protein [Flavobacterium sp. Sd200]|uniref:Lnb N-terminal periplasmic domain-containing protein n=1 Tax=Flavobacterium sp. Sd200 TaxID=2692211 RepID=UPI00136FD0F4|nr:DUF4105 domain-containing protein [Flavobacterium sp. Sd200]MXN91989.1 DUF4105 domain-containing protein [Flavobacterium sp. Sd200]